MNEINTLQVLSGDDIIIGNTLVRHPKLSDIKTIKEGTYGKFIRTFCSKPFDLVESLYSAGLDFEDIGDYELFNMLFITTYYEDMEFVELFNMFFDVFYISDEVDDTTKKNLIKYKIVVPDSDDEGNVSYCFIDENGDREKFLDCDNFAEIQSVIKTLTGYSNKEAPKFIDDFVKQMVIEDMVLMAELASKQKKNNSIITMSDLIGAIILDTSYTYDNVWSMYLYQFHSCTRMILKREDYKNTMTGIYSGSLDPKKIDMEKLYWLNN